MTITNLIQGIIDGLLIGGVYATCAVGLSMSFGVMRVTNWAHGALLMLSMYGGYYAVTLLGINPYLSMFLVAPVMFCLGYLLQRFIINRILIREMDREPTSVLLFTSGMDTFLCYLAMILFGSLAKTANTAYTGVSINIGQFFVSKAKLYSFIIAIIVTMALYLFVQKSETGRCLRAASQNRNVVCLMGIDLQNLYAIAMGIALAVTGIAGTLLTPVISVNYDSGTTFSVLCFIIVILGGKGNILGCLLGGLIVGLIQRVAGLFVTDSLANCIVYALFIVMLLVRPSGLLGKEKE